MIGSHVDAWDKAYTVFAYKGPQRAIQHLTTARGSRNRLDLSPFSIMAILSSRDATNVEHGRRHFGTRLILIIVFICFGTASFGFTNAVIGSTLAQPSFISAMHLDTASNASSLVSAVLAIYFIGGLSGALCHAALADRFGRKLSASVSCAIMIIAAAICTGAQNMGMYIAFRFFCGWA